MKYMWLYIVNVEHIVLMSTAEHDKEHGAAASQNVSVSVDNLPSLSGTDVEYHVTEDTEF